MKTIELKGTEKTPKFILKPQSGSIKILGRSTMSSPHEYYNWITKEIEKYAENPIEKTHLFIDLEYYNTSSSKYLLNILKIVSRINQQTKKEAKIIWYFDEEDFGIIDDIALFSQLIDFKIHTIAYEMAY